jgi:hypothetical protein
MYRVTQRLWRAVEGPRRRLLIYAARSFSTTQARSQPIRHDLSRGREPRTCQHLARSQCTKRFTRDDPVQPRQILFLGFDGRKGLSTMGKVSTAGVLRLRATSAVSRDTAVRRSAQDDDFVRS